MQTQTLEQTKKGNPASALNANGACEKKLTYNHSNTTETAYQDLTTCKVCGDRVAWADVHISGLCWRCAQDRDYHEDQDMYWAMAHGLA